MMRRTAVAPKLEVAKSVAFLSPRLLSGAVYLAAVHVQVSTPVP
jgi:hypothetical protein